MVRTIVTDVTVSGESGFIRGIHPAASQFRCIFCFNDKNSVLFFPDRQAVFIRIDIFNVFNRQGETSRSTRYDFNYNGWEDYQSLDWATGEPYAPIVPGDPDRPPLNPAWNTSNDWQDPRTIRLGVRLSF